MDLIVMEDPPSNGEPSQTFDEAFLQADIANFANESVQHAPQNMQLATMPPTVQHDAKLATTSFDIPHQLDSTSLKMLQREHINYDTPYLLTGLRLVRLNVDTDRTLREYLNLRGISPRYLETIKNHVSAEMRCIERMVLFKKDLSEKQRHSLKVYTTGTPLEVYKLGLNGCEEIGIYLDPDVLRPWSPAENPADTLASVDTMEGVVDATTPERMSSLETSTDEELRAFLEWKGLSDQVLRDVDKTVMRNKEYLLDHPVIFSPLRERAQVLVALGQKGNPIDVVKWTFYHLYRFKHRRFQIAEMAGTRGRHSPCSPLPPFSRLNHNDNLSRTLTMRQRHDDPTHLQRYDHRVLETMSRSSLQHDAAEIRDTILTSNPPPGRASAVADKSLLNSKPRFETKIQRKSRLRTARYGTNGLPGPDVALHEGLARLALTEHSHSEHAGPYIHPDRLRQIQETAELQTRKENSKVCQAKLLETSNSKRDISDNWKRLIEQARQSLLRPSTKGYSSPIARFTSPKAQKRRLKRDQSLATLPNRIAALDKEIATIQAQTPGAERLKFKKLEALQLRVHLEQRDGRLTCDEAEDLLHENRRLSRKKSSDQSDVEHLADGLAGLLQA